MEDIDRNLGILKFISVILPSNQLVCLCSQVVFCLGFMHIHLVLKMKHLQLHWLSVPWPHCSLPHRKVFLLLPEHCSEHGDSGGMLQAHFPGYPTHTFFFFYVLYAGVWRNWEVFYFLRSPWKRKHKITPLSYFTKTIWSGGYFTTPGLGN